MIRPAAGSALLLALIGVLIASHCTGLLYLSPALAMGALLLVGLYPGERVLARPRNRMRAVARRARVRVARPRPQRRIAPRGGLLLGSRLAGRGPPWRATASIR